MDGCNQDAAGEYISHALRGFLAEQGTLTRFSRSGVHAQNGVVERKHHHLLEKVPYGVHFKYNYFVREEKNSSNDIIWRPGPECSLSIPSVSQKNHVILVKDQWMETSVAGISSPSWGSWLMEADSVEDQIAERGKRESIVKAHSVIDMVDGASSVGEHIIMRLWNGTPLDSVSPSISVHDDFAAADKPNAIKVSVNQHEINQPVEEPWVLGPIVSAKNSVAQVKRKKDRRKFLNTEKDSGEITENMPEQDQPVEEPWLFQSWVTANRAGVISKRKVEAKGIMKRLKEFDKPSAASEKDMPASGEPPRVILINSSICSTQRIAVLEDGKLVELLLEPIKNNVHCDSIYLGIITKLVPHMGGAFVDIGILRPSLMSIKQNRDPFVYPQIVKDIKGGSANDSGYNHESLLTYDDDDDDVDDDMADNEFADEENDDDSSTFLAQNVKENEEGLDIVSHSNMKKIDGAEFENVSGWDDEIDDHVEDEYNDDHSPGDRSEICNDIKTLSSIQHALRESNDDTNGCRWSQVRKGTKIMVQVVKEGLGTKGPTLSPFPCLRSRFWILVSRGNKVGVSKKITGIERTRLKGITKLLRPPGFTLTARTVAAGHSWEELNKDLDRLLSTWKGITEHAQSAALAAEEGVEGAIPVMLYRSKGQALSIVQDDFNEKVKRLVVDSPRTYHEVTGYLQEVAPELCNRVDLYEKRTPIFDEYKIEKEIDNILCKRVVLQNGGSLIIEQTEALVSIDVNGGHSMFGQGTSQEKAILDVNLEAAKQIARELRLRDIGGIIVVDFIDMTDDSNKRLIYDEMKKAVEKDRSTVGVSELSKLGLMEITRKRVRPSVTFMISEPCPCCHGIGRVEALDTSFSKIEREICRRLAVSGHNPDPEKPKLWPRFLLRVDHEMCTYLTSGKRTKLGILSSSLKVWVLLKIARGFTRGAFELLPYSDQKDTDEQKELSPESPPPREAGRPRLSVFPIKKWMSRAKRAK
ncbi:ribonuclease E/G-like protein, chloroplastic isoform X6 [Triticum urartu]|uniref:ribonuclease E/G-like protein, chloroplastic isoform X6 n=1 Tax=Triticum urartu TaxID=4572 RepID=UPI0020433217|nr:ribonuclease E/G-like protein, chloroplastic isoform X6 [Triticum urartu]XP_048543038.1 ribonuclease E/G-like protein, chloroplastic isoform X6 [Triticum urartu]